MRILYTHLLLLFLLLSFFSFVNFTFWVFHLLFNLLLIHTLSLSYFFIYRTYFQRHCSLICFYSLFYHVKKFLWSFSFFCVKMRKKNSWIISIQYQWRVQMHRTQERKTGWFCMCESFFYSFRFIILWVKFWLFWFFVHQIEDSISSFP